MSMREGVPRWPRQLIGALLLAAVLTVPACSKEGLMRGSYETLHNISDQQNEVDPRYESDRPSYEVYRQQREELLHPSTPAAVGSPPAK